MSSELDLPSTGSASPEGEPEGIREEFIPLMDAYEQALRCGTTDTPERWFQNHPELRPSLAMLHWLYRGKSNARSTPAEVSQLPRIPGYEVLQLLNRGGMGLVFKARQERPQRLVAIKMILAESYGTAEKMARFRKEWEATARLAHPHIVQIHEVGEHQNRPYFTMEFVEGGSLKENLAGTPQPARQAARLVFLLAQATQHAHDRKIIHRDLKPSNILLVPSDADYGVAISGSSENVAWFLPKIADFGLAKQLDFGPEKTRSGDIVGTPSYMAPEQAAGKTRDIGPPADVYALGVILYELLIGRPPFRAETSVETLEQVRTQEPVPPRRLQPKVPRDLETICLKCLHKEPARRYTSTQGLGDDLQRFLEGRPILARPVGGLEKTWGWCRRNPVVAGLSCVSTILLLGGAGLFAWQWWRAEKEATNAIGERDAAKIANTRAEENLQKALDVLDYVGRRFGERTLAELPQMEVLRREVLENALRFHQEIAGQESDDPAVKSATALAWLRVAYVRNYLGQTSEAEAAIQQGIKLAQELVNTWPEAAEYQRVLVRAFTALGNHLASTKPAKAEEAFQTVERCIQLLLEKSPNESEYLAALAANELNRGILLLQLLRYADAESRGVQSVTIFKRLVEAQPAQVSHQRTLAKSMNMLAAIYAQTKRYQEARETYEQVIVRQKRLAAQQPHDVNIRAELATTHRNIARVLRLAGNISESRAAYRAAQAVYEGMTRDFPNVPLYHNELGSTLLGLGMSFTEPGELAEACNLFGRALQEQRTALLPNPQHRGYRTSLVNSLYHLAECRVQLNEHEEAAKNAVEMTRVLFDRWMDFREAAVLLIRCGDAAKKDDRLAPDKAKELAESYLAQAVGVLRESRKYDRWDLNEARTYSGLDPLRSRADFKAVLQEAEEEAKKKGK